MSSGSRPDGGLGAVWHLGNAEQTPDIRADCQRFVCSLLLGETAPLAWLVFEGGSRCWSAQDHGRENIKAEHPANRE